MSVMDTANGMKEKFNADAASGADYVFQFNIEDGENFNIAIKDGTCEVAEGESGEPSVTLIMNAETFQGIISGETDGMQAFMAGQLRAEGDMMLATRLSEFFELG